MPKLQNGGKGDSDPGSLDCEFSILPLSERALHESTTKFDTFLCTARHSSKGLFPVLFPGSSFSRS